MIVLRSAYRFAEEIWLLLLYAVVSLLIVQYADPRWASLLSLVVFVAVCCWYRLKSPNVDVKSIASAVLSGSFPTGSALFSVLIFAVYSSWMADYLKLSHGEADLYRAVSVLVFLSGLPFVFSLSLKRTEPTRSKGVEPKRVYVCALSVPRGESVHRLLEEFGKVRDLGRLGSVLKHNWIPVLMSLSLHRETLERAYILVSRESSRYRESFRELVRGILGKGIANRIEFVPPEGLSFDDYTEIHGELVKLSRRVRRDGYGDEDISVYISGGTSAVTLALTLFAVKEGRQVEYLSQTNPPEGMRIEKIDVGPEDIFALHPEMRR